MTKKVTVNAATEATEAKVAKKATLIEAVKPKYDSKLKAYSTEGVVGTSLMISDTGLKAIVGGVYVGIGVDDNGLAVYKPYECKGARGFDAFSKTFKEEKGKGAYDAAVKYLEGRYSITQKKYSFLVELARKGTPLRTKSEVKEAKAKGVA